MISKEEYATSSVPEKQGQHVVSCADVDPDRSCKDQNLEDTKAFAQRFGSSASQVSSSAVALLEAELHSTAEVTKSTTALEDNSKENSGSVAENVLSSASGYPITRPEKTLLR
ncbi:uncharacterized protein LOC125499042 [Beta vulgaris subsp. vulgaris]|uniref:uncharacterized protein LOC125499042 n=1 Tax=Beta vulgaris subsp. vulgaris TaxID=3555 RepID=UPI002036CFEB|nr:uncharacterized protein LOC125499042 [Beta vulgaris subsp. vulgaris]